MGRTAARHHARPATRRPRTRVAFLCLAAAVTALVVVVSTGTWLTTTSGARLARHGVDTTGAPTGEVCSFEVRKYKGSYTLYAAIYAYTVDGRRYEATGAAHFGEPADVPTDATGVQVRYPPDEPTEAIAHDEGVQRTSDEPRTVPEVTTVCPE